MFGEKTIKECRQVLSKGSWLLYMEDYRRPNSVGKRLITAGDITSSQVRRAFTVAPLIRRCEEKVFLSIKDRTFQTPASCIL
jgi:hypothetical protein